MFKKTYNTDREGFFVEVKASYKKDGMHHAPRGYYLTATPLQRYEAAPGVWMDRFALYDARAMLLCTVQRASKKAEAEADDFAARYALGIASQAAGMAGLRVSE